MNLAPEQRLVDPTPEFMAVRFGLSRGESLSAAGIAAGRCPKRIANERGLSLATVRNHLNFVFLKMGVKSQTALAVAAWRAWAEPMAVAKLVAGGMRVETTGEETEGA